MLARNQMGRAFHQESCPQEADKQAWICFRIRVTQSKSPVLQTAATWAWVRNKFRGKFLNSMDHHCCNWVCSCKEEKTSWRHPLFEETTLMGVLRKSPIYQNTIHGHKNSRAWKQTYRSIVCRLALGWLKEEHHKALIFIWPLPQACSFVLNQQKVDWITSCVVLCLVAQLCPIVFNPMDCSPSGSMGILHGNSPGRNTGVGCHALLKGDLHNPGIKPRPPTSQADSLLSELPGKPWRRDNYI